MTEEEYFRKTYPDYCYGERLLSPYWDLFQDGVEFGNRQSEKKIKHLEESLLDVTKKSVKRIEELKKENIELQHKVDVFQGYLDHDIEYDMDKKLTKAEKIIKDQKELLDRVLSGAETLSDFALNTLHKAEQFIKEIEK